MSLFSFALRRSFIVCLCLTALTPPAALHAEGLAPLFGTHASPLSGNPSASTLSSANSSGASLFAQRVPLAGGAATPLVTASSGPISMFGDRKSMGFFAPMPPRDTVQERSQYRGHGTSNIERLRAIISRAESSRNGYDAVQHSAKIKPSKRPTQMTVGEIYSWIDATPNQHHAIGRYQFIPKTLKRLANILGVKHSETFSPELQDALSDILLLEAGYNDVLNGALPRHAFMNNLAKIWAGLPTTNGKSHYHGYAGNKASITWAEFDAEMSQIFPSSRQS